MSNKKDVKFIEKFMNSKFVKKLTGNMGEAKKNHLLKCLSLIEIDDNITSIDFKNQNIFLLFTSAIEKLKECFFKEKKGFDFEINYFHSFRESIDNLKNASSIKEYNIIISNLKKINTFAYLKEFDPNISSNVFLINKNKIFNNFLKNLEKSYDEFSKLLKTTDDFKLKTGEDCLYIGYGLISGNLTNDKKLNTYLFNRPVKIKIENLGVKFEVSNKIFVNKNAILTLLNNFQIEYSNVEYRDDFKTLEPLIQYLKEILNYDINVINNIPKLESLISESDVIKILDVYGLVFYDLSENLLANEAKKLTSKKIKLLSRPLNHDNEYYKNLEIESNPLIQVNTPLNLFQKFALRSAINENTVIYGPPGTGKSETITSIVANILVNKETLVMCCQQQAAIDVVYERLKNLKDFVLYLNSYNDKDLFFQQIQTMSSIVGECLFNPEEEVQIDLYDIKDHERAKDYNNLNHKFLSDINDYIEFCKTKDSNKTDYKIYLAAKENVDNFIVTDFEKIKALYAMYSDNYYKLQDEVEFISKVSEYNVFINKHSLSDIGMNKLLENQKNFLEYLNDNNITYNYKLNYNDLKEKVNKLKHFLRDTFLFNDNSFNNQLKKNNFLLLNTYKILQDIKQKISTLKRVNKKHFFNKIISNVSRHGSFLFKVKKAGSLNKKNIIIGNYYSTSLINGVFNIFDWKMYTNMGNQKELRDSFFECVNLINSVGVYDDNSYLFELADFDPTCLDPVVVFYYYNPEYFNEQFVELFTKKIIKFPKPIMINFYKTKLNKIDHYSSILSTYKYEVLDKYPEAYTLDMDLKVKQYLKDNNDYINKMNSAIYDFYKSNVRKNVLDQPKRVRDRMLKMFKVASNEIQLPNVKEFIIEYYNELKVLYAGWLIRPELVSDLVPLKPNQFDVVVFDEASQVVLEKSYPILYRAKRAVITGDSKQLQPRISPYVLNKVQKNMRNSNEIVLDNAFSLLDRAKTTFWNTYYLKNHYRSVDYRLIDYSNLNFYDNQLIYLTQNKNQIVPFKIIDVYDGEFKDHINIREAELIFNKLLEITNDEEASDIFRKILVICFTKEQAEYIRKIIFSEPIKNKSLIRLVNAKRLIINNYENIQGEEGDLSIISFVYDANAKDLGTLSSYQANNFLNVTITRSKKQNIIYKSLNYQEIKDTWDETRLSFANYINYLDKLKKELESYGDDIFLDNEKQDSFIHEVYEFLKEYYESKGTGYKVVKELKIGSFKTDIAIYKGSKSDIKLCLMLNEFKKHLSLDEFLLDLDLYNLFIARGYKPMWVLYTQWISNKKLVIHKIDEALAEE